ncbi:MAG TPA: S-layer homology domain-containing protein [Thermoanaerobaculia bacterium]|nr:S-layer homology domain-containing protein [Thermoanaerobaculia bacterium]
MKSLLGWISPCSGEVHPRAARAAVLGILLSVAGLPGLPSVAGIAQAQTGSSTAQNPTVTFSTPGTKTVTLKACNLVGCGPTVQKTVVVLDPVPKIASLTVPSQAGIGAATPLVATATGRPPLTYRWVLTGPLGDTIVFGNPGTWTPPTPAAAYSGHLEVQNADGQAISATFNVNSVASTFADVPPTDWAWRYVEILAARGITGGCSVSPKLYCPVDVVTRAQMAVFLLAAKLGTTFTPPACVTPRFNDVPCSAPFAAWINELAARGVTSGCGNGNYCPTDPVTRDQMAVFLLATFEGTGYAPPPIGLTSPFLDVPYFSNFAPWIKELAVRGITGGCGGGNYCPRDPVTRAQMAVFLTGTFSLTLP